MTAEVVIMNKLGMSLAADSAITSGRDGVQKVYNTANKLFSLSSNHPVGIMIYGAASFMEVPWDIIIKSYRDYLGARKFPDLTCYMEDFIAFLCNDARFKNKDVEEIIVYRTFSDALKRIVKKVEAMVNEWEASGKEVGAHKVNIWLEEAIKNDINLYEKKQDNFLDIDYQTFQIEFKNVIDEIKEAFITYDIPEKLDELLYKLAYEMIIKDYFSVGSTGFVIAGYGEEEIFPHLLNYRLEGFVFGQLKHKKLKEKVISYTADKQNGTASITAFAQREMIDSFMGGIEPDMEDAIFGIIDKVLSDYHQQIQRHLDISFTKNQVSQLETMGNALYESIADTVEEYKQNHYILPLLGVVRSLPKEELAEMTETLVNLTSFKRRVTRATESVGPPVDVAVITKGDGFIWIKRKNYINPDINNRF